MATLRLASLDVAVKTEKGPKVGPSLILMLTVLGKLKIWPGVGRDSNPSWENSVSLVLIDSSRCSIPPLLIPFGYLNVKSPDGHSHRPFSQAFNLLHERYDAFHATSELLKKVTFTELRSSRRVRLFWGIESARGRGCRGRWIERTAVGT